MGEQKNEKFKQSILSLLVTLVCFVGAWIFVDLVIRGHKFTFKDEIIIPLIFFAVFTVVSYAVKKIFKNK